MPSIGSNGVALFSVVGLRLWFLLVSNLLSGPGPTTKKDWKPLAQKHLANRKIIFHTDSAKAYKLKLPGVIHDAGQMGVDEAFLR